MRGSERFDLLKGKQRGFDPGSDNFGVGGTPLRSFAAFAPLAGVFRLVVSRFQRCDLLAVAVAREERGTVGAHVARDVGAHGVHARELLERAQHGIIEERAALNDDLRAHIVRVADFDNLEQRILDNRDGQARGDVAHRSAFLLRLLHAGVHEHGAAASQVNGVFRMDCRLGEFGNVQVQARREALDEAAATRRARFVQHDMVDHAILHAQALHVLAADIEDELHARKHLLSAAQVRDRLDLARVDAQRLKEQRFAVAGDRGMPDGDERFARLGIDRHVVVELGDGCLRAPEHVALVRHVVRPEEAALLVDERRLERGRARVDAQVGNARVIHETLALHALGGMALVELVELGVACEQRRQAHDLGALDVA